MSAVAQAPALDAEETARVLELHFPGWLVSFRDGRWTATGRGDEDEGLTLEGETEGELAMALIWHTTETVARFVLWPTG